MNFDEFLVSLVKIEKLALPAEASQFKMSPPFRKKLMDMQKETIKKARKSAVLALFYPDAANETKLVLILRRAYNGVHSAQISFPGGKLETNESAKEAALRETFEEVGVHPKNIEVVKELTQVYIPPSNFYVQPFIGISKGTPNFVKEEKEVEQLLEVKLKDFLDDANVVTKIVSTSYDVEVEVPAYYLNDHFVWGATAMMLSEVKDLLKAAL